MPYRLWCLLHRAVDFFINPRYAKWQTGRRALRPAQ
jgi:hypothetical protein